MGNKTRIVVFTSAGKRVWTNMAVTGRVDTLTSMCSAVLGLADQFGERIVSATAAGPSEKIVVLQRSELTFVAAGKGCEAYLARELEYAYEAIVMALTTRVHRVLATSPGYDVGELLGSTGQVLEALLHNAKDLGEFLCGAVKGLRLDPAARAQVGHVLSSARIITTKQLGASLVFGFLFCGDRLVQVIAPQATSERSLRSTDVLLLANYVSSQRQALAAATSSWVPVCLPRFENRGYLHAYVSYLDDTIDLSLVLVGADDQPGTIAAFQQVSNSVQDALERDGVLASLRDVRQSNATAFAANRIAAETNAHHFLFSRRRPLMSSSSSSSVSAPQSPSNDVRVRASSSAASSSSSTQQQQQQQQLLLLERGQQPQGPLSKAKNWSSEKLASIALSPDKSSSKFFDSSSSSLGGGGGGGGGGGFERHVMQNTSKQRLSRSSSKGQLPPTTPTNLDGKKKPIGGDYFAPAKAEDAVAQCVATEPIDDDEDADVAERTWLAYRDLALRLRCNSTSRPSLPSSKDASAHDVFETPLPNAVLYEVDGPRTYVALTGPNFELFATFLTFDPVSSTVDTTRRLLAMLQREEAHFFFDPIFYNPAAST